MLSAAFALLISSSGNSMAPAAREAGAIHDIPAILNNLAKAYAGTHFAYDSRGNMVERLHHGQRTRTSFLYDPLGRRIAKRSEPIVATSSMDGSQYHAAEYRLPMRPPRNANGVDRYEGGNIAWEANYKAWGEARLTISEAARKAGIAKEGQTLPWITRGRKNDRCKI